MMAPALELQFPRLLFFSQTYHNISDEKQSGGETGKAVQGKAVQGTERAKS